MTKRIDFTTPPSNSTASEINANANVLPHSIFEKAVGPASPTRPLANVTLLRSESSEVIPRLVEKVTFELRQSPGIEIVEEGGRITAIQPPSSTTQSRELLRQPKSNFFNQTRYSEDHYEGPLVDGKRQGRGILFYSNGNRYEGEFFNNLPEGDGTLIYNTGITYVGKFRRGQYDGKGTLTLPNEGCYEGEFKDGLFDGFGTFNYCSGDIYAGYYEKGIRHGQGILTYLLGGSYAGEYKDDKRHGHGTLTSAAGDIYVGGFKCGLFDGRGNFTFADGSPAIEGRFANNLYVSKFYTN